MASAVATVAARDQFVDIDVPPWAWGALLGLIAAMLAVDLFRHRDDHAPRRREALIETLIWVGFGLAFSVVVLVAFGTGAFGEYLSGYVIEKSLSVDNVFVWAMLFGAMRIPVRYQHRVLFWGIFGALALRAVFIVVGSALIAAFWWVLLLFGALLVATGVRVLRHRKDEASEGSSAVLGLVRRFVPVSADFDGHKFFTRANGRRMATPLFAALVAVELTDVVFAVDSVPAILAVSNDTFLVFASNAFAILGLRAMYFVLADAKERFHYLSHALGAILIFVGLKMTVSHWFHMPTAWSLGIIVVVLAVAIVASNRRAARTGVAEVPSEPHAVDVGSS